MKLVTALDSLFLDVTLRIEVWLGRYAWRLSRWLRTKIASAHEAFLRQCRRAGWLALDVKLVKEAQIARPPAVPRYPSFFLAPRKPARWLSRLYEGVYLLDDGTEVKLETLSWRRNPFAGALTIARLCFNSLEWVKELVDAYHLTGQYRYMEHAKELTKRWMAEWLYVEQASSMWGDHSTALRAIILCQLWNVYRESEAAGSRLMCELLSAIFRHAHKLAHPLFYRADHNHGVTQAYALFAIGLLFPMHPQAQAWAKLGQARLEAQMADNVAADGLHREHSPYYHFYVFRHFVYAYRFAQAYGVVFSQAFTERLQAMLTSGAYLLKPDGTLPALGDTCRTSDVLVEHSDVQVWPEAQVSAYRYSSSQGQEGTPPGTSSVLFQESGMAFLRSGWGITRPFRDECYLAFRIATLRTSHIHRDVFSFELYAYGDDLIVDSGGPYAYAHPLRDRFFLSTRAHNTVVVDHHDQAIGAARVLYWSTSEAYDVLDAEHENYPGVIHRRTLVFVRPDYFLLVDRLTAEHCHCYAQLFHLQPHLQVIPRGLAIVTQHRYQGPRVQIVPLLDEGLGLSLHHGTQNPYQGWVSPSELSLIPNTVAEYQRTGTNATFAVLIVPEHPRYTPQIQSSVISTGIPFQNDTQIQVNFDAYQDEICLPTSGNITVKRARHDHPF